MARHTKGRWYIDGLHYSGEGPGFTLIRAETREIAKVIWRPEHDGEDSANADLIGAASGLYAALQQIADACALNGQPGNLIGAGWSAAHRKIGAFALASLALVQPHKKAVQHG